MVFMVSSCWLVVLVLHGQHKPNNDGDASQRDETSDNFLGGVIHGERKVCAIPFS